MPDAHSVAVAGCPRPDDIRAAVGRDLQALRALWIDLERRASGSVFQSYAWCRAWSEAAAEAGCRDAPRIVTVWHDGRLVLLWPLVIRRFGPLRVLQSFGDPATQYADALVAPGPGRALWLEAAWRAVRELGGVDALLLKGVRDDAAILSLVAPRDRFATRAAEAPFCDFRATRGRPRSGRTRNALQRHLRHLGTVGPVRFEVVADPAARAAAIADALRLKHAWLRRTGRFSAGYAHPANTAFLRALAASPEALVLRLSVAGETAAVEAGLVRDGTYASLVQAYDARHAAHGPGRLLFWHLVENAAELRIAVLDFLAPASRHKSEWATGAVGVRDYAIPVRPGGWLLLGYVRHLRPRAKRLRERLGAALTGLGRRSPEMPGASAAGVAR